MSRQKQLLAEESGGLPKIAKLAEFQPGDVGDCFVLLVAKERNKTRDGKPYYRLTFRDSTKSVTAMVWSDTVWFAPCEAEWQTGDFYKVRCQYSETQYGPQIDLDRVRPVEEADAEDGFERGDFFTSTRFDTEAMFSELKQLVADHISELPLRNLVLGVLEDFSSEIPQITAAVRNHHAYAGGFLEHVLSVARTAVYLADKYADYYPEMKPPLSKSLVVAGAVLHDIGKVQELDFQPQGSEYTAKGRLIGHILLGRDLVREKAASIEDLNPETLLRLEHIIVSHQNLPEWGSPVSPHTPEALLVYFSDDIDAKFHMMATALMPEPVPGEEFTERNNPLRRAIFRGISGEKE